MSDKHSQWSDSGPIKTIAFYGFSPISKLLRTLETFVTNVANYAFFVPIFFSSKTVGSEFFGQISILKKFEAVRPSWLISFYAPFNHFNMSLKSVRIHIVNVSFLGDWPVLQFLGERLRGQVGRQCYFLLSGLILCRFLLRTVSQCYFFQSDYNINDFFCQFSSSSFFTKNASDYLGWWWWRFFHSKRI